MDKGSKKNGDKQKPKTEKSQQTKPANTSNNAKDTTLSTTAVKTKPTRSGRMLATLAIIIAFIAAAAIAYTWQQLHSLHNQVQDKQQQLNQQLQQTQSHIQQLSQQVQAQQQILRAQTSALNSNKAILHRFIQLGVSDPALIATTQANDMARLANYNLQFQHNIPAAIQLLNAADKKLQHLRNPTLINVRQALTDDILALKAVPKVDLESLLLNLTALNQQVDQLPTLAEQYVADDASKSQHASAKDTHQAYLPKWREALDKSIEKIQKLVVIRHNEQAIQPLLDPQQKRYLLQNLHLLLGQAQWAAINQNQAVFETSLTQAKQSIEKYFDKQTATTKNAIQILEQLQKLNIQPQIPNINSSLTALQQASETLRAQATTHLQQNDTNTITQPTIPTVTPAAPSNNKPSTTKPSAPTNNKKPQSNPNKPHNKPSDTIEQEVTSS